MDNIVDYLVVLFFVISFLSSIFKKKKTNEKNSSENKKQLQNDKRVASTQMKRASNPLDDFFKSINEEFQQTQTKETRSEVDEYFEKAMQKSAEARDIYKPTEFKVPIPFESLSKTQDTIAIKSYKDSVKLNQEKHESKKAKAIRNNLKQNSSIKNFIIMNEILGKPKALQR